MKRRQKVALIVLAVILCLFILRNFLIKTAVTTGTVYVTGAPVKIDKLTVGVFKPVFVVKGFKLYNPPGFPKEPFVEMTEVAVQYDPLSLFRGKIHLRLVILKLKEMIVVKDKEGKLNVDSLKFTREQQQSVDKKDAPAQEKKPAKKMEMLIDEVHLDLGKVIVKDFTREPPLIQAYDIGVHDKVYRDLKSADQLAVLVMMEAMGPTALKSAAMYGAATVLGIGFLPAGIAGVMLGKDSGVQQFNVSMDKVFNATLEVLKSQNAVISVENRTKGQIKAKVSGADVAVSLREGERQNVEVKVSARKLFVPRPEIANGILYQISEKLK